MLKFLRKYQAWLLAVGGSLLMVAWLLPSTIGQMGNMGFTPVIATIAYEGDTHEIRDHEWRRAAAEMTFIESLYKDPRATDFDLGQLLGFPPANPDDPNSTAGLRDAAHWLLLKTEADLAGLIGGPGDGESVVNQLALVFGQGVGEEEAFRRARDYVMGQAAESGIPTYEDALQALAHYNGIQRLIDTYRAAPVVSDVRLQNLAEDLRHTVSVAAVLVDAGKFIDEVPEPTEEELQAHFEKYRDVRPGEGEFGLGYRLEDRAQVEYLTLDYDSVLESIPATGLNGRRWYDQNRPRLEAGGRVVPPFDEIADDAIAAYRREKAEEKMAEISQFVKAELLGELKSLPRDGEYRVLPGDWEQTRLSLEDLRQQIQDRFGVEASYTADTQKWLNAGDLAMLEGIGASSRPAGAAPVGFVDLVFAHKEFENPQPALTGAGLQAGVVDPVFLRSTERVASQLDARLAPDDAYLYRVIAVDRARPPQTLDEVRDQAVKDVKRIKAFEKLQAEADTWVARAAEGPDALDNLAESLEGRVLRGSTSRVDSRRAGTGEFEPSVVSGLPPSRELTQEAFARLDEIGLTARLDEVDMARRVFAVSVPERLGLAVVRLERHDPVSREDWTSLLDRGVPAPMGAPRSPLSLSDVLVRKDFEDEALAPFSFEAMKKRFDYVEKRKGAEEEGEMGATEGIAPPSKSADSDAGGGEG